MALHVTRTDVYEYSTSLKGCLEPQEQKSKSTRKDLNRPSVIDDQPHTSYHSALLYDRGIAQVRSLTILLSPSQALQNLSSTNANTQRRVDALQLCLSHSRQSGETKV